MSFTAHFHYLVNSIVLLAPAGIQRRMPDAYKSIFFRLHSIVNRTSDLLEDTRRQADWSEPVYSAKRP